MRRLRFRLVARLDLTWRGVAVDSGTIDARVLAPALLAASGIARSAQQILYPDGPSVSVRVVAHNRGSFELALELAELIDKVVTFFASSDGNAVRNIVGTIGGTIVVVQKLRGRRPVAVDDDPDSEYVVLRLADGETIQVPRDVNRLLDDRRIRQYIEDLTEPVEREDFDALEIEAEDTPPVTVTKDNVAHFRAPTPAAEIVTDETFTEALALHTIRLESRSWMFRRPSGSVIHAVVEDEHFWQEFQADHIFVSPGSILRARLHLRQTVELDGELKTTWTVTHVLQVLPPDAPAPSELPLEEE